MGAPQIPIVEFKTLPIQFGILTRRNRPSIKEVKVKETEEYRHPTTMEHTLVGLFNNKMEHLLLLIDFAQTRAQILEMIDELGMLTRRLEEIASGLNPNSTHGTH